MKTLLNIELKKQFKNPILTIIIVTLLILMSLLAFVFDPQQTQESQFEINQNLTIKEIYDTYQNNDRYLFLDNIQMTEYILGYYNYIKNRSDKINQITAEIKSDYNNLEIVRVNGRNEEINTKCNTLYTKLEEYCFLITDFDDSYKIKYLDLIAGNDAFLNNASFSRVRELTAIIDSFIYNGESNYGNKVYTLLHNSDFLKTLETSTGIANNFISFTVDNMYEQIKRSFNEYQEYINSTTGFVFSSSTANKKLNYLKDNFDSFVELYLELTTLDQNLILCKNEIKTEINNLISGCNVLFDRTIMARDEHQGLINELKRLGFVNTLNRFLDSYTIIMLPMELVDELNGYLTTVKNNFEFNETQINNFYASNNSIKLQETIFKQTNLVVSVTKLINNTINLNYYNNYSLYQRFIDENQIYTYKCETTLAKYYITTNTYSAEVIENMQFNYQTNNKISCYDYIVFAMQIATVIILIYLIFHICGSVSGEVKNGTLGLMLMSPNNRSTILSVKILTTVIITLAMLLLSLIVSSISGIIIFGELNTNIVTIFNAENIITMPPAVSVIINFVSHFICCIGFIFLFYLISVTFKNHIVAIIVTIVTSIISLILSKIKWSVLALLPTNNFNFYKYFNVHTYTSENILNKIFDVVTYSSQNFYISLAIYLITVLSSYLIALHIFKNKSY